MKYAGESWGEYQERRAKAQAWDKILRDMQESYAKAFPGEKLRIYAWKDEVLKQELKQAYRLELIEAGIIDKDIGNEIRLIAKEPWLAKMRSLRANKGIS